MNLSLQPKKFINSEHTGDYVQVSVSLGKKEAETTLNIHYMDEGTGEPLVLVHAIGQSMFTWHKIYDTLKRSYRVIAFDLEGHGYSEKQPFSSYSVDEHVEVIAKFLKALGISTAHFIGFSTGCIYVTEYAKRYPERIARIILMSPGGITPQMPASIKMLTSPVLGVVASSLFFSINRIHGILEECYLDLTLVTSDVVDGYAQPLLEAGEKRAIRLSFMEYNEDLATSEIRKINNPVLILRGSDDKWHSSEIAELYHAALKSGSFAIIRNAGHMLHEEKPEKVIAAILEYITVTRDVSDYDEEEEN